MNELDLFAAAIAVADAAERAALLERECKNRPELRARMEALLGAAAASHSPLDCPVAVPERTDDLGPSPRKSPERHSDCQAGAVIVDKYTLVERIGEGGMGSVWRARQTEPVKRFVAVKLIKAGMDSRQVLARFDAERQALALMDHPNIAKVLDGGMHEQRPFFVMELVKGVPITQYCDQRRLTPKQRLELFVQACQAIQHAHQKGIIHRDIKPSNVLVALYDDRPVVKVIDFGVAKATGGTLTEATIDTGFGGVVGTPEYMSPEQATLNNLDIDTRSDVYALGVLLYELLAGSPPFSGEELKMKGLLEILRVVREEEPPRPSTKLSTADALPSLSANRGTEPKKLTGLLRNELDWIVMKALEKDRTRRYETASSFAADVQRYLFGDPVVAHPPSAAYRLRKFFRRNRPQVIAVSVVLLALVSGIAGTTIGLFEAWRQERIARDEALAAEAARQAESRQRYLAEEAVAAERLANEQTEKRLKQIEKGVQLFAGMLTGINPRYEKQGDLTVYQQLRERAAKAADELEGELVADSLTVARLQTIFGNTLRELGDAPKAVEVLERARATRERELGPDHPDTLDALQLLALAYRANGRLAEAIALYEHVRDALKEKLGADHPSVLTTLHNLAAAYSHAGRLAEATALLEHILDEYPDTNATMSMLGWAYRAAGRDAEAIALLERVRDARVKKLGPDHPNTLSTLDNLAGAYRDSGKLAEAITLFEEVRDVRRRKLGADHPDTLRSMNNLALAYRAKGRLPDAIAVLEQVRDAQVSQLGVDHSETLITLYNLAVAYRDFNQRAKAIPLFEKCLERRREKLEADHPDTLLTMSGLALAYLNDKQYEQAITLFKETLDLRHKKLGPDHPDTLRSMNSLAISLNAANRRTEAIPLFEECLKRRRDQLGADHADTLRTAGELTSAYEDAGNLADGTRLRRELVPILKTKHGAESVAYGNALSSLGRNLLLKQEWADAEPVLNECLAIREKLQPDEWTTFNTQSLLGGALLGQKKYADAEPFLLNGYEGLKAREKSIPPQWSDRVPEALDRLIELYAATDKPDEVKKYRELREKYPAATELSPPPQVVK